MTAQLLLVANAFGIVTYIFWQGLEKFYWESFGTWVISPIIYVRICPEPFKYWLLTGINSGPLSQILCMIPVAMGFISLGLAALAIRKSSVPLALAACGLMSTIFIVYHSVKHMGMQLVLI